MVIKIDKTIKWLSNNLPPTIFSFCILEQIFDRFFIFQPVKLLQLYFLFFLCFRFKYLPKLFNLNLLVYILIILLYVIACLKSNTFYIKNKSELFNIFWWSIFSYFISLEFATFKNSSYLFFLKTSKLTFVGSICGCLWGIFKFNNLISSSAYPDEYYNIEGSLIPGSSLNADYNIFSLGICLSLIFSFHLKNLLKSKIFNIIHAFYIILCVITVFLSGSRRGSVFVICTVLMGLFIRFDNRYFYKSASKIFKYVIPTFIGLTLLFIFFFDEIAYFILGFDFEATSLLRVLTVKDELVSENERSIRWKFAGELINDYSLFEIFFGKNFDYISLFGARFDQISEDNPHNFLIATFLYGGILSVTVLLYQMIVSLIAIINKKEYYLFFIVFIYLILFGLTSSNTLFDGKLYSILCVVSLMLPKRSDESISQDKK